MKGAAQSLLSTSGTMMRLILMILQRIIKTDKIVLCTSDLNKMFVCYSLFVCLP